MLESLHAVDSTYNQVHGTWPFISLHRIFMEIEETNAIFNRIV